MKVLHLLVCASIVLLSAANGIILNNRQELIREEDRRGAGKIENPQNKDLTKAGTASRSVWAIGQIDGNIDHQQKHGNEYNQHEFAGAGPDNLGYPYGGFNHYEGYNQGYNHESMYGHQHHHQGYGLTAGGYGLGHGLGYGHSGSGAGEYGHSGIGESGCEHTDGKLGHGEGFSYGGGSAYTPSGGGYGGLGGFFGKKLPLKKLFLPIAGLALFGAAAALSTNPVLLQLGTISGRRKRSSSTSFSRDIYPDNPFIRPN